MSKPGRSRVIRLAEAQASIPGPAGERAVMVLQRGTLDVALGLPLAPEPTDAACTGRNLSRTLPRTSPCGVYFTALMVARSQHRVWRWSRMSN